MASTNYEKIYNPSGLLINKEDGSWVDWNNLSGTNVQEFIKGELEKAVVDFEYENSVLYGVNSLGKRVVSADVNVIKPSYRFVDEDALLDILLNGSTTPISGSTKNINATSSLVVKTRFKWHLVLTVGDKDSDSKNSIKYRAFLIKPDSDGEKFASNGLELSGLANYSDSGFTLDISKLFSKNEISSGNVQLRVVLSYSYVNDAEELIEERCILDSITKLNVKRIELSYPSDKGLLQNSTITFNLSGIDTSDAGDFKFKCGVLVGNKAVSVEQSIDSSDTSLVLFNIASAVPEAITKDVLTVNLCARVVNSDASLFSDWLTVSALYQSPNTVEALAGATVAISYVPEFVSNCDSVNLFNVVTTDKMLGEMTVHVFKSNKESDIQNISTEPSNSNYYMKDKMQNFLFKTINMSLNGAETSKTEKYFSYLEMDGINDSNNTIYLAFVILTGSDASNAEVSRFCVPGSTGVINSKAVRAVKITNPKNASELMHVAEGKIIDYSQIAANKKFNQDGVFKELFAVDNLHDNIDSTDGMTQDGKYMGFKISPLGTEKRTENSFLTGDPSYETPSDIVPINLFKNPIKLQDAAGSLLPSTGAFSIEMLIKTYNVNDDDDFILSIGNLRLYPHYLRLWSRDLGYENGEIEFSTPYIASCANFSKDEITHIMITYNGNYKPSRYLDTVYNDLYPNFGESNENGGPKNIACLKIYINGVINRSISIDANQLLDFNLDFSLQIHPSNSNINIYGFRTYSKCLDLDQIQRNRISAFASLDAEKIPFLEVNDLLYKASDYTSDGWTKIYEAGLANTISIRKCLGITDERYADKTKKYTPKNVMLIVTDDEGPLYYGNKKFPDYIDKEVSMKYHDAAMFIKYAHNADEDNEYASKYNGKFIGIYQVRENGYAEYYKALGSSAKRYGGAFNIQFSKFYFVPESKLSLFSLLVDNKFYDADAASEWVESTTTDENDNTITTYKTNVLFDFKNPEYLQVIVDKNGKKSYLLGDKKYDKKFNTVMEKIAKKKYTLPTDPSKAEVKKLVGKVNYASSMQSHKQGACDLYVGCYPLGGKVENDYMLRRAVKEDVFYYFYIKRSDCKKLEGQDEVTFRNITWNNINFDKVRFFGILTWGSAKMDKATFGLNDEVDLEYLNIEGADNKNASTNFKCPWAAQQVWADPEAVNRNDPYYSSIEGNYKNPEAYIKQFLGYKFVDGLKVPDYTTGLLIDDETIRYKKPSEDETTKGADAIEKGPDSWDVAGNAVEETHDAHFEFINWGDDFTDTSGAQHTHITPIEKSFNSFARLYNYIYSFDFGNLELLLENEDGNHVLDTSVPGISESKKYVVTFSGQMTTKNGKTYEVNEGDVFRWDQVFERFVPAGLYYNTSTNEWETFNIGTEYDEMKKAVIDNDPTSRYWEVYSKGLANYTAYTNTENSDFFTKGSSLLTIGEGGRYHYFQGSGDEAGNLGDVSSRDSIFEMFRGAFADMFKCAIWAYCDVNSFAYHQAAIRFLSGTDNRAKNIYFVLKGDTYKAVEASVYKLDESGNKIPVLNEEGVPTGEFVTKKKTYYEVDPDLQYYHNRHLWTLFQDDLDTIFATDNNGQQSKDYNLLEPIYNNETMGNWGDSRSGLWYNFDLVFEPEIKHHLKRIVDWAISSGAAGNGTIYNESNNLYKSFLKIQKEIIPAVTYNHMSEIYYDTMQFVYRGGKITDYGKTIKGFNDNVFNNNLVANPESLVHGGCFESEKQFLKKRVALLASYCSDFKSEDSLSSIKPLGKTGGGDLLKIYMKMKDLSFIQDFYPNILGNKVNDLNRTYADPIVLTYNPPSYLTALSRSGDQYEINRFELASGLTSRDSVEHTDYYKTVTFTEGVSSVSELAMNNVSELRYELPDYLEPDEFTLYIYKEGVDGYDNRGINFKPVNEDDTKRILYLDKLVKNVEILDVPYSKFTKDIIDISQCQRLKELNLSYATSTIPITNILLPKSNKLSRVTIPSNIKLVSIEYYPGIKHFEYNGDEPEDQRSWFAFDSEDVNLTSITIDLRNKWAFEFLEKYAKRGVIENIVFKNTPSTLNINLALLQLLIDLPTFDFDSKVTLNISGKVGLTLKGKMAKRWGNIDSSANRVYCVYDSIAAAQYKFDTTSPTIGATGQTVGFTITDVNGVDANNIEIAGNNLRITYSLAGTNISGISVNSTTGEFNINPGTKIQGKSAILTIKAYVIGATQPISDSVTVIFGAYKPAAGDIVYSDGSISKSLNPNKNAVGFIFWSKLISWLPESAAESGDHTQETYDIRVMAFSSLKNVTKIEDQQNIVSGLPLGPCGSVTESQAADYYSSTITVAGQRAVHQIFGTGTAWHADFDGDQDLKSQIKVGNNEFKKPTGTSRSVIKIGQEIPDGESNINLYCGKYTTENAYNYVFTKNSAGNSSLLTRVKNYYTDFPYSQIDTSNYDEIYTYLNTRTNQPALGCVLFPGYVKTHLWYPNGVDPENTEIGAGTWYVPSAQEYSYLVRQKLLQIDDGTVNDALHIEDWNKSGRYFYEGLNLRDISSKPNVFKTLLKNMKANTLSDFEGINIEFIKNNLSSLRSSTAYSTTYSEKNNNVYVYEDNSSYGSTDGPQWNASGNIGWGYSTKALLSERDIIYPCCRIVKQIDLV